MKVDEGPRGSLALPGAPKPSICGQTARRNQAQEARGGQDPAQEAPSTVVDVLLCQSGLEQAEARVKNNALRKNWSEGYMSKENHPQGTLLRKRIFERSLRPKGYVDKATKKRENTAKPV